MQRGDPFLCAVGADEHGERLVRCAHRLASVTGLRPLFAHLVDPGAEPPHSLGDSVWRARSLLRHAGARGAQMRVGVGPIADELIAVAREEQAVMIIAAARGFGPLKSALLGSVSRRLMECAPVPVMILPPAADPRFDAERVLCLGSGRDRLVVVAGGARLARVLDRDLATAQVLEEAAGGRLRFAPPPRGWPGAVDAEDLPLAVPRCDAVARLDELADAVAADVVVVGRPRAGGTEELLAHPLSLSLANRARRALVVVPTDEGARP